MVEDGTKGDVGCVRYGYCGSAGVDDDLQVVSETAVGLCGCHECWEWVVLGGGGGGVTQEHNGTAGGW